MENDLFIDGVPIRNGDFHGDNIKWPDGNYLVNRMWIVMVYISLEIASMHGGD